MPVRPAARHRFSIPLSGVVLAILAGASLLVGPLAAPASSQWSGGESAADTPVVVRGRTWYLRNSNTSGNANIAFLYGDPDDIPVMGDWNGDGVDTPGVVRGRTWYLRNSNTSGNANIAFLYGDPGDTLLGE